MKAYAIKDPKGFIKLSSVREFKDECIDCFNEITIFHTFESLKKEDYRCVPVEITEIKSK